MSAPILFLGIDIATIVCAALVGVRIIASWPRLRTAQLVALIAFNGVCDVILGRYDYRYWIPAPYHFEVGAFEPLLNLARNLTPGVFMILTFLLFTDRKRFPRLLLALFAVQIFLDEPIRWLGVPLTPLVTEVTPALLQILFGGCALYWTVADWRGDLIESRRRVRMLTSIVIGLDLIVSGLLSRLLIDPNTVLNYQTHVALVASHLAIWIFLLFQLTGGNMGEFLDPAHEPRPAPVPAPRTANSETASALARLTALLEEGRIYRRAGLSLADLAARVGLPEYRLRALIHEELGYPNFNAFLHAYRIHEAVEQLRDPALRRTPILTIALSVGYQSVNTFNRGFRDVMGMTPSAFRAQGDEKTAPETE